MKSFARWLFIQTHHDELMTIARYCRERGKPLLVSIDKSPQIIGEARGALDTMSTLNLFVD